MANLIAEGLGAEVLGALVGGAREALPYIVHGVSAGLSANRIGQALAEAGLGIRRSNLLTLVRAYQGTFEAAGIQRGLPSNALPPSYIFFPSATFMKNPFAYILKATVQNNITGLVGTRSITVSSPTALTNEQIADYAENILVSAESDYHVSYLSHTIEEVLVDPRYLP